jgi:hypothetical protein
LPLAISATRVGQLLNVGIVLFLIAHIVSQYSEHILGRPSIMGLVPRFDMNRDLSVPTFFSALILLSCAGMLALIALAARLSGDPFVLAWSGLAVLFAYLSVDEAAALHELTSVPLREALGITTGWLHFAWVIPGTVALLIIALLYRRFVLALPPATRNGLIAGVLIMVVGAVGVEIVGGWYRSTRGYDFTYALLVAGEEVLEMKGTVVLLTTFIVHFARTQADLHLRFVAA